MTTVKNFFNPNRDMVTIFTSEGEPHECTRLNARELVASQGFRWKKEDGEVAVQEAEEEPAEPQEPDADEPSEPQEPASEPTPETPVDHDNDPLTVVATAIAGDADVEKYLNGFTEDDLRIMSEKRYGQKPHHKAGKEKIIDKMIAWEEEKLASEMDQ